MAQPGVMVAVDVDNLLISSAKAGQDFRGYAGAEVGFDNMFQWIQTFGTIVCAHFYISYLRTANEAVWHGLWERYRRQFLVETIFCPRLPRKKIVVPGEKRDNVDAHLIEHTERLVPLLRPQAEYFCLASGDADYSPLLWSLKRDYGMKIAFEIGSEGSFARIYTETQIASKHPATGKELVHIFSPRREAV